MPAGSWSTDRDRRLPPTRAPDTPHSSPPGGATSWETPGHEHLASRLGGDPLSAGSGGSSASSCGPSSTGFRLLFGILIGLVFDRLAQGSPVDETAWAPAIAFAVLAIGRNLIIWLGDRQWINHWIEQSLQLRRNLLRWLMEAPGSRVIPLAPGQAVSTFRDDVDDVLEYMENWVDMGGLVVFGVGAVAVMASIDAGLTAILLIPLVLTMILTQALSPQIRKRRRAMRAGHRSGDRLHRRDVLRCPGHQAGRGRAASAGPPPHSERDPAQGGPLRHGAHRDPARDQTATCRPSRSPSC